MTTSHINLDTDRFTWNHGHAPRGTGRWLFQVEGEGKPRAYIGAFSKVRKQIDADLKREGLPKGIQVLTVS